MRSLGLTRKVFGAVAMTALLAGCPDPGTGPDARVPNEFDAEVPAPPDANTTPDAPAPTPDAAPMSTHTGTISIHDMRVEGFPQLGRGLSVTIDFPPVSTRTPDFDDMPGQATGCKAWLYDLANGDVPAVGGDEGTITITGADATIPPCTFVPGRGYLCIASAGMNMATVLDDAEAMGMLPPMTALVTITGATFTMADVGRYVTIAGETNPANTGAFPVVALGAAPGSLVIANPVAVTDPTSFMATWSVIAGLGPVPNGPDPIGNDDTISVAITPGGGNHFHFGAMTMNISAGDEFTLDMASQARITSMPLDGSGATLSCNGAGGTCGMALGMIVLVQTTDANVTGLPPFVFPGPTQKMGLVRCAMVGAQSVTVPASAMDIIKDANPTRVRTIVLRVGFAFDGNPDGTNPVTVVAGHSVVGFTTAP